nr:hypothetical protein [Acinetobacter baumannii]
MLIIIRLFKLSHLMFEFAYLSIYFPIVMIPIILFLMFKLLANGICPWCKCGFFMNDLGSFVNGLSFIFRKQCSHCGKPEKLSKNEDDS